MTTLPIASRLALILVALSSVAIAQQPNRKLTTDEFRTLVTRCAPGAAFDTMRSVSTTESSLHIYAISLNRPQQAARKSGFTHHRVEILRQPNNLNEAVHWMNWFLTRGYTVSVGLMQINIENAPRYGLRPQQLFDPCTNVAIGADVLARSYHSALKNPYTGHVPALDALSAYNSGSYRNGYTNGYVGSVMNNHRRNRDK